MAANVAGGPAAGCGGASSSVLVLDVDHTLLQGITPEHYSWFRNSSYCASFSYEPSTVRYQKYLARMVDQTSGRMVHFSIPKPDDGKSMQFFVSIRPCLAELLSHPRITSGEVPVVLASANEDERTAAILDKLPMFEGNKTMTEHLAACHFIPRALFLDDYETTRSGRKRIGDIRKWAEDQGLLPKHGRGRLVFVDDKAPGNIRGTRTRNDFVFWISPFDLPETLTIFQFQAARWKARQSGIDRDSFSCCSGMARSVCRCAPKASSEDEELMQRVRRILFEGEVLSSDF